MADQDLDQQPVDTTPEVTDAPAVEEAPVADDQAEDDSSEDQDSDEEIEEIVEEMIEEEAEEENIFPEAGQKEGRGSMYAELSPETGTR